MAVIPVLTVLLFFSLCGNPAVVYPKSGKNLDRLIERRNQEKTRLTNERQATLKQIGITEKRTVQVVEALKIQSQNIERSQKKLNLLKKRIFKVKKEILGTSLRISELEKSIENDKREINQQLQALYTLGRVREMTLFIGLNSFQHYFRNQKLLQNNTHLDIELLNRLSRNLEFLQAGKASLDNQRQELDGLKQKEEGLNRLLKFERQQQVAYLRHLRTDRTAHVRYLREIQVELEHLNDNLYTLAIKKENQKKSRDFRGFYPWKNKLPSPVSGKIVHRFGQKRSRFYTLFRRGVLIETAADAPVNCILGGKVVWAGPFRGYKNLVILDHGKGSLSVYGNLSELFVLVGEVIDKDYILGNVGFDGVEERSLFYFEMRYNKKAVNPIRWLKKPRWKR